MPKQEQMVLKFDPKSQVPREKRGDEGLTSEEIREKIESIASSQEKVRGERRKEKIFTSKKTTSEVV